MKHNVAILLLAISLCGKSQFNPLFPYFYGEQNRGIEIVDDKLVFLHHISEYPNFGSSFSSGEIQTSFSTIYIYSTQGNFIRKLEFPDTDSLFHFAFKMTKLSNSRIVLSGEVWRTFSNNQYDPFIAILKSDLSGFDDFFYYTPTQNNSNYAVSVVASNTDELGHFLHSRLNVFNNSLEFLRFYNNTSSSTCQYSSVFEPSHFFYNNHFYTLYFQSGVSGTKLSLMKYPNSNSGSCSLVFAESTDGVVFENTNLMPRFSPSGKKLTNNNYLIHGKYGNTIPFVLHIDEDEKLTQFFSDTTLTGSVGIDFGFTGLDFFNNQFIYFAYSSIINNEDGILLYCMDNQGNLKWKNFYPINEGLEFDGFLPLNHIKALPNNDCIVTIGVKGYLDKSDVYILRVDSNGNVKNFVTSVNSIQTGAIDVKVYPNPANDVLNIELLSNENFTTEMYNLAGQKVKAATQLHHQTVNINISDFSKGMYFYQIKSESGNLLKAGKFLKE